MVSSGVRSVPIQRVSVRFKPPVIRRAVTYGLVFALVLFGCEEAERQANQPPTQTTNAPDATSASWELGQVMLEWLLSPTIVCPGPPHVRPFPDEGPFAPMLELLGLTPIPPDTCVEGAMSRRFSERGD